MSYAIRKISSAVALAVAAVLHTAPATASPYLKGSPLYPTQGTDATQLNINWQGLTRTAIVIQPSPLPAGKTPAIVMLHYDGGTSALMANLTRAGSLAAQQGYTVILPQGINYHWNDDPADTSNTVDDVGYLTTLINTVTTKYPVDASRVSMAGFSNGAFMTQRMSCERPDLIASAFAVGSDLRLSTQAICAPPRAMPMVFINGTDDPVVAYDGYRFTMLSAPDTYSYWGGVNRCDLTQTTTTAMPALVADGTSITQQHDAACSSKGSVDLYTVSGGGHAWPGGTANPFPSLGVMSQNLDATTLLGNFAKQWTTNSTY